MPIADATSKLFMVVLMIFTYIFLKDRHKTVLLMFQSVGSRTIYGLVKNPIDRNASTLTFMSLRLLDRCCSALQQSPSLLLNFLFDFCDADRKSVV